MQPIIQVSNLTKTYASGLHALKNINLEIRSGEIFALLGPNGAGKTTTVEILEGLTDGDWIVTAPSPNFKAGQQVRAIPAAGQRRSV